MHARAQGQGAFRTRQCGVRSIIGQFRQQKRQLLDCIIKPGQAFRNYAFARCDEGPRVL